MLNYKSLLAVIGVLVLNSTGAVYGQFVVAPKVSQHAYAELIGALYKQTAQDLNEYFVLPHEVQLTSDECDQVNAFYVPADADKPAQIVMCTELVGAIVRRSGAQATERTPDFAVFSQLYFILLHEVGHALIDVLDLPVVGQEEDAVDQLAKSSLEKNLYWRCGPPPFGGRLPMNPGGGSSQWSYLPTNTILMSSGSSTLCAGHTERIRSSGASWLNI